MTKVDAKMRTLDGPRSILKFSGGGLAERQVRATITTADVDRVGDIVVPSGIDFSAYLKTRTVLFNHDANMPIAKTVSIGADGVGLSAVAQFPSVGVSAKSDEIYGLIKAGVINSTSIGFIPHAYTPIDPKSPWDGLRFTKTEILEWSFCSVPANAAALVTERRLKSIGVAQRASDPVNVAELLLDAALVLMRTAENEAQYSRACALRRKAERMRDGRVDRSDWAA